MYVYNADLGMLVVVIANFSIGSVIFRNSPRVIAIENLQL